MALLIAAPAGSSLEWHPHPEVWVALGAAAGAYLYAVHRIGPLVGESRPAPSGRQILWWMLGLGALAVGSTWPVHDLAERSSFAFHTLEHLLYVLVAPPLLLAGTPRWLARRLLSPPPVMAVARVVCRPVLAFVIFNATMLAMFWPPVVEAMLASEAFHLGAHGTMILVSLVMWMPVLSPLPELPRLSPPLRMAYLFVQSVLPTVPASFLTFASAPLYPIYEQMQPAFGLSVLDDQQVAGLLLKIGGGLILWTAIAITFFRWYGEERRFDGIERELRRTRP